MNTKKQTHIMYGFITALAMMVFGLVLHVAKLGQNAALQWLPMVLMLIGLILNAQAYSKANDADVTFGQVFGSCFKATAIIALVMAVWSLISVMIFPEIREQALEKAMADMEKRNMSEEQIDMSINITKKYFNVFAAGGALFGCLFMGAIASLIAAAIAKKAPRQPQVAYEETSMRQD